MSQIIPAEQYRQILVNNTPLIDVRAPVEFARGSFPAAVNLPLLDDREREAVGTAYRKAGQQAAVAKGHQLVSGKRRQQRLTEWREYIKAHPDALIYCFRGGLRSRTAQEWLAETGLQVPRIAGGYKAMRRFLMETVDRASTTCELLMVAGKTGSGKTELVNRFNASVDLEGLANHRGSAFGRRVDPQPGQIDFENQLAIRLLQIPFTRYRRLVVEDEGRAIGSLAIPLTLFQRMGREPLAVIEEPLANRVDRVLHAYIEVNFGDFLSRDPESAENAFQDHLQSALQRIQKRLGGELFSEIGQDLDSALALHFQTGDFSAHRTWIEKLLRHYYDPMYEYQLAKKAPRIVFRGSRDEFLHWASRLQFEKDSSR